MSHVSSAQITREELSSWTTPTLNAQLGNPFWYAVHTASRHEKQVDAYLTHKSVETFLPLFGAVHRWKSGKAWVELPLFPGYMFVRIPLREKLQVLQAPGVVSLVGFRNRPIPISEQEIAWMRTGLQSFSAQPYPYLKIGEKVRIKSGLLAGAEGILVRHKQDFRVVLSVDLIMRSVAVEVDACDLELIGHVS